MSFSPDFLFAAATLGVTFFMIWCLWSLMWGNVPFSAKARKRKEQKIVLGAAQTFILSYEDLPAYRDGGEFAARMGELRAAVASKDVAECKSLMEILDPPKDWAAGREWLDILVVSISVAMAFRAYFYEPFNIPTGSMQPTLYCNHSIACSPEEADFFDSTPLKWFKWILTGEMYEHFQAPFSGVLQFRPTNTGHYDMRVVNALTDRVSSQMLVPTDVLHPHETGDGPYRQQSFALPNGLAPGSAVRAGQTLWSGKVVTGDFLFVNRWLWNFRHPRRGDLLDDWHPGSPAGDALHQAHDRHARRDADDKGRTPRGGRQAADGTTPHPPDSEPREMARQGIPIRRVPSERAPRLRYARPHHSTRRRRGEAGARRVLRLWRQLSVQLRQPLLGACPRIQPARHRRRRVLANLEPPVGRNQVIVKSE